MWDKVRKHFGEEQINDYNNLKKVIFTWTENHLYSIPFILWHL
jgi:hypothetical protein